MREIDKNLTAGKSTKNTQDRKGKSFGYQILGFGSGGAGGPVCITYDFLDANNIYQGGAISPGFEIRYKSLNQFTGNLPLLDADEGQSPSGKNTEQAIHAGIYFGIIDEINARIKYYELKYDSLTVILTGGDANKLPKTLKNSIFAHPNFMAEGMFHLLKLNIDS